MSSWRKPLIDTANKKPVKPAKAYAQTKQSLKSLKKQGRKRRDQKKTTLGKERDSRIGGRVEKRRR